MSDRGYPSSRAEARELVQSIASDHGHIPEEVLDQIMSPIRQHVEHAMFVKDRLIATSVVT